MGVSGIYMSCSSVYHSIDRISLSIVIFLWMLCVFSRAYEKTDLWHSVLTVNLHCSVGAFGIRFFDLYVLEDIQALPEYLSLVLSCVVSLLVRWYHVDTTRFSLCTLSFVHAHINTGDSIRSAQGETTGRSNNHNPTQREHLSLSQRLVDEDTCLSFTTNTYKPELNRTTHSVPLLVYAAGLPRNLLTDPNRWTTLLSLLPYLVTPHICTLHSSWKWWPRSSKRRISFNKMNWFWKAAIVLSCIHDANQNDAQNLPDVSDTMHSFVCAISSFRLWSFQ